MENKNSIFKLHLILMIVFIYYSDASFSAQNLRSLKIKTIDHLNGNIAKISIDISAKNNVVKLEDAASAEKIIINLNNKLESINNNFNLTIQCISHCGIELSGTNYKDDYVINNLKMENAYLIKNSRLKVNFLHIYSTQTLLTGLPIVTEEATITLKPSLDMIKARDLIKGVNIIPASGEYVYDTKIIFDNRTQKAINCHNEQNIANSLYNLKSLKKALPNLSWTSPVVAWFATSKDNILELDVTNINVLPAVETIEPYASETWKVSNFKRNTAHLLSVDENKRPNFGGTINDESLVRYIETLRQNGLKVMFYPMLFLDMPTKPWRGKLTGKTTKEIDNFFTKKQGYNAFILHYAKLLKNKVDAFIIGSELEDLLQYTDETHQYHQAERYPAVIQMEKLAKQVRKILGKKVVITYAANWSEYHHNKKGFNHLDYLWASPEINVIGIDAYLPLTSQNMGDISVENIKKGWESGELWDYFYNEGKKIRITPEWGLKRIEHWWSNHHWFGNKKTLWQPKMKKIWFTEFGFPSIRLSTHSPATVPTPKSGNPDFSLQMRAIRATLEYWGSKTNIVENSFLWAWDARPFPYFPQRLDIWSDGDQWPLGHWINGKVDPISQVRLLKNIKVKRLITNAETLLIDKNSKIKYLQANKIIYNNKTSKAT